MQSKILNTRSMMAPQDTYVLRGIAMLMIIVHHGLKHAPYAPDAIRGLWGDMGTAVFFFISGFGLCCSMSKRDYVDFTYLWQNTKKLIIPYLIVWFFTEIVFNILYPSYGIRNTLRDVITLSYPSFESVNLWFIKVIVISYIVSILTFIIIRNRLLRVSFVTVICMVYIYIAWKVLRLPQYWFGSFICFPAGMWLSAYKEELKGVLSHKIIIAILSLVLYVVFLKYDFLPTLACFKYSIMFCLLFVSLGSIVNIQSKPLYFIGKNSLLFYLIHIALLFLLSESKFLSKQYMLTLGIILVGTIALVYLYVKIQTLIQQTRYAKKKEDSHIKFSDR